MIDLIPWKKRNNGNSVAVSGSNRHALSRFRDDFNALAERVLGDWQDWGDGIWDSNWGWRMEIDDRDDEFVVLADAPGFEAEDFDVQLSGNRLIIRAEQKQEEENQQGTSFRQRSFHRSLMLPVGADIEQVEANYRNGVLEIHLPKGEETKAKRISVQPK